MLILGFLLLTDEHNQQKSQTVDILMMTPVRCVIFLFWFLAVFHPVLLFCSWLARRENPCCNAVPCSGKQLMFREHLQFLDGSEPVLGIMAWAYSSPRGI
jgi:hypothetical protein